MDFAILLPHLEARDRAQIILYSDGESSLFRPHNGESVGPEEIMWDLVELDETDTVLSTGGIRSMCAFGFRSLLDTLNEIDFFETEGVHPESVIESLVEESLQDAYGCNGVACDVEVSISVEFKDVDLNQIEKRFRAEEPVSKQEVQYLISNRRIEFEEMVEYVRDETRHKDGNGA
jgi:hypothetical protein